MINKNKATQLSSVVRNNKIRKLQQNPSQSMNRVYSLLNHQQQTIDSILNKYKDNDATHVNTLQRSSKLQSKSNYLNDGFYQNYMKPRSQTIQPGGLSNSQLKLKLILSKEQRAAAKPRTGHNSIDSSDRLQKQYYTYRQKNRNSRQDQLISLPVIYQNNKIAKVQRSIKQKNSFAYQFKKQRLKMQSQLYKIYGQRNVYFDRQPRWQARSSLPVSRSKPKKPKKKHKQKNNPKALTLVNPNPTPLRQSQNNQQIAQNKPNNIIIDIQSQDQDQSEEQVQSVYYQRQFRDTMRVQCTQQLNFLYFARNEQMKQWTDNLLSMIEKHDKEVTAIRRKSRYLRSFDDKFFSIGVYNSDDL